MHKDKYIFAQLVALLNRSKFNRIVAKYQGDKYVKHFTCWNQLLALMFGQLCNRESLRDLICALDAHHDKCYHLGMGKLCREQRATILCMRQPSLPLPHLLVRAGSISESIARIERNGGGFSYLCIKSTVFRHRNLANGNNFHDSGIACLFFLL